MLLSFYPAVRLQDKENPVGNNGNTMLHGATLTLHIAQLTTACLKNRGYHTTRYDAIYAYIIVRSKTDRWPAYDCAWYFVSYYFNCL